MVNKQKLGSKGGLKKYTGMGKKPIRYLNRVTFYSEGYAFCQSSNTKIMVTPMQILSCNSPQHFIVFLILSPGRNVRSVPASAIVLPNFVAVFVPVFFLLLFLSRFAFPFVVVRF